MTPPLITSEAIRATLERQAGKHGETLAGLSRMIGRNDRYLDRFVRQGSPKRLADREIDVLAAYFRIDPRLLGGKRSLAPPAPDQRRRLPGSFMYSGTRRRGG